MRAAPWLASMLAMTSCGGIAIVDGTPSGDEQDAGSTTTTTTTTTDGGPHDCLPSSCPSGFCVDGVCCDAPCSGVCEACSAAKSGGVDGVCSFVPNGQDPDAECSPTTCDGAGTCTKPCGGKTCADLGFECGTCSVDSSGCATFGVPWADWNASYAPEPGDSVLQVQASKLTGDCSDNGGANTDGASIEVGQYLVGQMVGAMTFELADLPSEAKVVGATLHAYQWSTSGLVYTAPMTTLVVDHVRFESVYGVFATNTLTAAFTERPLSTSAAIEWKTADVTEAVRYDRATCRTRTQLRVRFTPANSVPAPEVPNLVRLRSDDSMVDPPYLEIRYR